MARYITCEVCNEEKHDDHFGGFDICEECASSCTGDVDAALEQNAAMKAAMHEIDRECNRIRANYRSGSMEEQIASFVKSHLREFLK